jgi:hypothetical protein
VFFHCLFKIWMGFTKTIVAGNCSLDTLSDPPIL